MELDFSLGMRKCLVLFIEDLGVFPKFWAELGHYALSELGAGMELLTSSWRSLESNNNLNVGVLMRLLERRKENSSYLNRPSSRQARDWWSLALTLKGAVAVKFW